MQAWYPVQKRSYGVLGLSRTGLSVARWLKNKGAHVVAWDDDLARRQEALQRGICVQADFPWSELSALIQSPGVPLYGTYIHPFTQQAQAQGVPIVGDCDVWRAAYPQARCVGITGTNGKSTTTALVGHILNQAGFQAYLGGNIGKPILDLKAPEAGDVFILELSSYQLDLSCRLDLDVAVFLNLEPDHLDRHGTLQRYKEAKERIFQTCPGKKQIAIFGESQDGALEQIKSRLREGGQHSVISPSAAPLSLDFQKFPALKGAHNHQNAAAAYTIARQLGVPEAKIINGLKSFPGLAHRQEHVASVEGIEFINDSKATNKAATARALATYSQIYWIAGGRAKSEGITGLHSYFPKIRQMYAIGEAASDYVSYFKAHNTSVSAVCFNSLDVAVRQAYQDVRRDLTLEKVIHPVILFSPAAASFDQFKDFEHRGDVFRESVHRLYV